MEKGGQFGREGVEVMVEAMVMVEVEVEVEWSGGWRRREDETRWVVLAWRSHGGGGIESSSYLILIGPRDEGKTPPHSHGLSRQHSLWN